ncbi:hypothetical protein L2E82_45264 [Cichorium intybus]|uniref:Uncharacterized protein n=1 Tax=Cichorium intybus TaxID=13427 RepID=A0ACB8ZSS1_CICIN|nr:hypothetical protein L2E82_45264 [Cichorium intybus]
MYTPSSPFNFRFDFYLFSLFSIIHHHLAPSSPFVQQPAAGSGAVGIVQESEKRKFCFLIGFITGSQALLN